MLESQGAATDMEDQDNVALKHSVKQSISKQKYDAFDALTFAAKAGDVDVVRDLLRRGADINQADYDGRTAFAMVSAFLPTHLNRCTGPSNQMIIIIIRINAYLVMTQTE